MKLSRIILSAALLTILNSGLLVAQKNDVTQFQWIAGNWKGDDGQGIYSESWKKVNADLLTGEGYYVIGSDTVLREVLRIERIGKYWTYIPIIGDNNPVLFTMISADNNTWTFENKEHDFPQRIVYTKQADGSLKAWIEGTEKGEFKKEEYVLQRSK